MLYVSAWDEKTRAPLTGLGVDAFAVREDGTTREVLRVDAGDLADADRDPRRQLAGGAQSHHRNPPRADLVRARASTASARSRSSASPIARPSFTDYTTDLKQLDAGIGKVFAMPGSGATLLDAIVEVSKGLGRREEDRAAMVMLTTENIEFSTRHYQDVLEELKKGGAQMHAVILNTPAGTSLSDEARNRASVLDRGPRESGGTRTDVLASQAFQTKMLELAAILKSQHRVVYARPETLIPPEKIEVSATKPGVEASGGPARGQAVK